MASRNSLVDLVSNIAATTVAAAPGVLAGRRAVAFRSGRSGLLDMSQRHAGVWADVLNSLRVANAPAYVEIDPANGLITRLLVPLVVRVGEISSTLDGVEVELIISHARHTLRRDNPDYDRLLAMLHGARDGGTMVAVTETEVGHEIIEVTPLAPRSLSEPSPLSTSPVEAAPAAAVTPAQTQQMYDLVAGRICCPASAASPCITFSFPDDGCWGRAHEMCRLMIAAGVQPDKVWIFGNLRAPTQNNPRCVVNWGWHVAPTLTVGAQVQVIDPSLFPGPVPQATWAAAQGDPAAALISTPASVFWRNRSGSSVQTDPTYTETERVLNTYRQQLRLRAVGADGPPPYIACLPPKPGTQWYGTLAGNTTGRWFTHGWPATWHVLWTIMPLTACPGAPQLSWRTRVERASASQATYWIEVRNLTANTVRFEGRYDVVSR